MNFIKAEEHLSDRTRQQLSDDQKSGGKLLQQWVVPWNIVDFYRLVVINKLLIEDSEDRQNDEADVCDKPFIDQTRDVQ